MSNSVTSSVVRQEATILAGRLALKPAAVERWMKASGITSITDLMGRYPGAEHAEAMSRAADEIFAFEA